MCGSIRARVGDQDSGVGGTGESRKYQQPGTTKFAYAAMPQRKDSEMCCRSTSLGSGIDNTYSDFRVSCCEGSIEERWTNVVVHCPTQL